MIDSNVEALTISVAVLTPVGSNLSRACGKQNEKNVVRNVPAATDLAASVLAAWDGLQCTAYNLSDM